MNDVPWSLHLLAELLSVFDPDVEDVVRPAVDRIAEAVDAEVVVVIEDGRVRHAIGVPPEEAEAFSALVGAGAQSADLPSGTFHALSAPLRDRSTMLVGRMSAAFDVEEKALLRAMARTLAFLQQLVDAVAAERSARSMAERHAAQTTHVLGVLRERNRLLDHLAGIQRAISERSPTEELLAMVVEGLLELTGAVSATLYVDDVNGTAVPLSHAGDGSAVPVSSSDHPVRTAIAGDEPRWSRPAAGHDDHWCLAAPVHRDGSAVGALALETEGPQEPESDVPFHRSTLDALTSFADHASLALNDASAREALDQALAEALHQATHDALTGLPNRAMVVDHLGRRIRSARLLHRVEAVTVLFVDVDRFKQVNDLQGHAAGDRLLQVLAERLRSHVREGDVVGRLAGDEFVVITEQADPALADELAARLVRLLAEPVDLDGRPTMPSVSVGVAHAAADDDAESLLANADLAMYRAKQAGRGRHEHYDTALRIVAQQRATAELELRRAIVEDELVVHYQPLVRLPDRSLVGVEALVRWRHPSGRLVMPGEFVPMAEETGLVTDIDSHVLRTACAKANEWNELAGGRPMTVSVNLSAHRFSDPALPDAVAAVLEETGLAASRLFLEITESTMMEERAATATTMSRLLDMGVQLSVDDFGTGYSSLRYLTRFPVGVLKIDRSFVDGLGSDREAEVIVEAVIGMAGALGIGVVGEGVENDVQADRLAELGCSFGQGYLFGRPAEPAVIDAMIASGTPGTTAATDLPG